MKTNCFPLSRFVEILIVVLLMFVSVNAICAQNNSPLCFTARNGNVTVRFDIKNATHTILYSVTGSNWNTYTSNSDVTINSNQSIYFCAASDQIIASPFSNKYNYSSRFYFSSTNGGKVEGSGNIMSLYGPSCPNLPLQPNAFKNLFNGCTLLTTAPLLPADTLANDCYLFMFAGCTSLTAAPVLPATSLAHQCYTYMFSGCSSLITPPSLPSTSLAEHCYRSMFQGCTSLLTTPSLPATSLADNCYDGMFSGCTSITTPPHLPATSLADFCYSDMFAGCTSISRLPALPATVLADYCYSRMFYGCYSLCIDTVAQGAKWIIPATSIGNESLTDMFASADAIHSTPHINTTYYVLSGVYNVSGSTNDSTMGIVSGSGAYNIRTMATLTAIPNPHCHLENWSNGDTTLTTNIYVTNDTSITAIFKTDQYLITALPNSSLMGSVVGAGSYDYGQTATLSAIPNYGYHFVSWNNGDTSSTISFVVTGDITYTATFAQNVYSVTATANYADRGFVTGSGRYLHNSKATLSATPNDGFVFSGWDNGETNRVLYVIVVSDTVITAIFEPISSSVDDVEVKDYIVYSNGNNIHINGAAGEAIRIYDINGKLISEVEEVSDEQIVSVNVSGVYFVRINDKKSIKVVVN